MSAQDAGKKVHKHPIDNDPEAGTEREHGEELDAVTEPEPEAPPKSKGKPEPPAKATAESKRAEGSQSKSSEEKGKSMAQIMRFDRRGGKRRR